jgi:hypothetical protein
MPRLYSCIIPLPTTAGKRRESLVFSYPINFRCIVNVLVRIQVNHLSAMLLTVLLLPCLFKAVSSGTSPNPRIVIVGSDVHYWTKFSETEVESDNILQKLSDKNYCTSWWDIPFRVWRSFVTPFFLGSCLTDTSYRSVRNS